MILRFSRVSWTLFVIDQYTISLLESNQTAHSFWISQEENKINDINLKSTVQIHEFTDFHLSWRGSHFWFGIVLTVQSGDHFQSGIICEPVQICHRPSAIFSLFAVTYIIVQLWNKKGPFDFNFSSFNRVNETAKSISNLKEDVHLKSPFRLQLGVIYLPHLKAYFNIPLLIFRSSSSNLIPIIRFTR